MRSVAAKHSDECGWCAGETVTWQQGQIILANRLRQNGVSTPFIT